MAGTLVRLLDLAQNPATGTQAPRRVILTGKTSASVSTGILMDVDPGQPQRLAEEDHTS